MSPDPGAQRPSHAETTQDLLCRAMGPVSTGFSELYERLGPSLLAWARVNLSAYGAVAGDADDVLQEVWLRALSEFPNFDPKRATFRAWLFGIAKNVLYELWRQGQRRAVLPRSPEQTSALEAWPDVATTIRTRLARNEILEVFLLRVEEMDSLDKSLVLHCGFEDMSCPEAARRIGIAADTASKRWRRLRERLSEGGIGELLELGAA